MLTLDEFQDLQRRVEADRRQRDEARGRASALRDRLKAEFGCADATAGRAKHDAVFQQLQAVYAKYTAAYQAFKEAHGERLGHGQRPDPAPAGRRRPGTV